MVALAQFAARYPFGLDPFQVEACEALAAGEGVLVAAPTGAGKTIVGEFAAFLALRGGRRCFYTTPIKALSNQKYADLVAAHGVANVGLLTGDTSRNGDAPVVVMTTEVLRNMLYASPEGSHRFDDLAYVVMDEVHYLADRQRGAVWEEVIIHLPAHVQLVSLSATVSNAEEFAQWLVTVRGHTRVIVSEHRPVPLWQHVLADRALYDLFVEDAAPLGDVYGGPRALKPAGPGSGPGPGAAAGRDRARDGARGERPGRVGAPGRQSRAARDAGPARPGRGGRNSHDGQRGRDDRPAGAGDDRNGAGDRAVGAVASDGRPVNPELLRLARLESSGPEWSRSGRPGPGGRPRRRPWVPSRPQVIERLDRDGLLPAITFVFSRVGCDAAVAACAAAGLRLTTSEQAAEIRAHVRARTAGIPDGDLRVLGYWEWLDGLERGLAAHHAGMLPVFKEVVEELFVRGLVRAVFATETLALGINMPARTVVLERLSKFNGQTRADITPGEYTQLTGRAGRRGIDIEGHAVVLWQPGLDPLAVAGLASTRTYPLRSSFRPSYNMAVNLVGRLGAERARTVLESSFAQFQADRAVVGLARQVRRNQAALDELTAEVECDRGSAHEYDQIRRDIREREKRLSREGAAHGRAEAAEALARLRTGDVVRVPAGRRMGLAVVLDVAVDPRSVDEPRPLVLTADRQVRRLSLIDFPVAVEPLGRVRVPRTFNPRDARSRRDLASSLHHAELRAEPGKRERARSAASDDAELARLRRALRAHPVHDCPRREEHLRKAERATRLRRETEALARKVEGRTNTVARTFDRVRAALTELDYLDGDTVTPKGARLARIYTEQDLIVAVCLDRGVWEPLTPAALAAAVSSLVFEPRGDDLAMPALPGDEDLRAALGATHRIYVQLSGVEQEHGLDFLRPPELGFVTAAYGWASGRSLERILGEDATELTAGDFVRWMRQLLDLLDQIAQTAGAGSPLRSTAREAMDALRRGVVAYSMTV
ncbi:DEAD/DEAH box helicase [Pseudofrankia sp. BMG5.36]|uniref:DEAD/DEAH box helicase n=1 Tax=Pseudofrankia sp. BMG5.36 TaxID=1834512 RepID=UPI0008DA8BAF|nr:DEAD/DEAH box helicase [Pseudofrankia sp. BMG5.36]OHV50375.1 RNA helicase [Pseudofrankia sp. BMG5.36]